MITPRDIQKKKNPSMSVVFKYQKAECCSAQESNTLQQNHVRQSSGCQRINKRARGQKACGCHNFSASRACGCNRELTN